MQEFVSFCEPRRAAILVCMRAVTADSTVWGRLLGQGEAAAREAARHEEESYELQRQAVFHGAWDPYLASMRRRGARYARAGLSYSVWFELVRVYRDAIGSLLNAFLQEDPPGRLAQVLTMSRGMNALANLTTEQIAAGYLDEKQRDAASTEDRYRLLFDNSPLPMWTFDRETLRFLTVNEAAVRDYGYTREEFASMTLDDIRPPEDRAALRVDVANAQGFSERTVWRHRKKDGTLCMVEIRANDFDLEGTSVRLVVINDVTGRVQAEEALRTTETQLRHAQKMEAIGRLAGSVAHDFNNVLTVVQSYACLLEEGLEPDDSRLAEATEIRRAAERAAALTRQLLTLGRHSIVAPRRVDIAALVTEFMPMLSRLVGETVTIATRCAGAPEVIADPGQLEQILMNLAVNARDAMADGGRLTIECHAIELDVDTGLLHHLAPGPYLEIAVTDTGTGMDAETQARIFEPFFTTKDIGLGTGLGLSIVHGIVAQAGGRVAVYSEPGHGTTFRIQLPVASGIEPVAQPEKLEAPRTLPALHVLVVDDQPQVRAVAARILEDAGCTVIEAATADEARKICVRHEETIDVALLDLVLGDGRGDVLTRELRQLRPEMVCVLMSGYSAGVLTPNGGAPENLLPKPFSPSELRAAIARVCPDKARRPSLRAPSESSATQHRALVADDDEMLRRSIVRMLRRAELDVVDVDSGYKAITALESEPFDVVISDVQMPDGGGLDLLRAVRRIDLDVPVILMTGQPSVEAAAAAVEYGAFRYLTKPLDTDAFIQTVKYAARAHALARIRRDAFLVTGAHAGVTDRAGLEVRFEQALDGLWMAFQPIIDARTGALFGVEALMRSSEPSLPNPPAVLDAAAQLGRLPLVGRKVRSLSSRAILERTDDITVFVNLHPEDLHDIELVDPASPLARIASRVILEVTERTSLETSTVLTERIARLRQLGFRLAVDDIGAGYSGLTSFTELTPEVVKIDMSLVRDVHKSALKQRTIAALCRLCHEVGTLVVGEGVETLEEREVLVGLGCDLLQGYLLGRPQRELP